MSQDEVVAVMKARNQHYELVSQGEWERVRLQCFYAATAFGGKIKKPTDLFKLPWDVNAKEDKKQAKAMTSAEVTKKALKMGSAGLKSRL
jgi:hypothetical protein